MFPRRGSGVGLLVLRISVAATLLLCFGNGPKLSLFLVLLVGAVLASLALAIGIFTAVVSPVVCVYAIAVLLLGQRVDWLLVLLALNSIALALLGPGAYSLDARLFGLRVIVVPPHRDTDVG